MPEPVSSFDLDAFKAKVDSLIVVLKKKGVLSKDEVDAIKAKEVNPVV